MKMGRLPVFKARYIINRSRWVFLLYPGLAYLPNEEDWKGLLT